MQDVAEISTALCPSLRAFCSGIYITVSIISERRVRREGNAVILEPIGFDVAAWRAEHDRLVAEHGEFLPDDIPEPTVPPDDIDLDAAFDEPDSGKAS